MEREANYLAVGSFVLLVLAMGVLFIYWYSSAYHRSNYARYEVYFNESISGLTVGSPVRYLGVDVGQVQSVGIDTRSSDLVQVLIDVAPTTPVSSNTVARLSLQGITGLQFIDLRRAGAAPPSSLTRSPSQHYPVIASEQSSVDLLLDQLPALTARVQDMLDRGTQLLSDRNIAAFDRIADNLDQASTQLPDTLANAGRLVHELRATLRQTNAILADLHAVSGGARTDLLATLQRLHVMSDNLARTSARLDTLMSDSGPRLSELLRDGGPQLEALLRDSRAAMQQIDALARSLRDNPSQLLYQSRPAGVTIPP